MENGSTNALDWKVPNMAQSFIIVTCPKCGQEIRVEAASIDDVGEALVLCPSCDWEDYQDMSGAIQAAHSFSELLTDIAEFGYQAVVD